MFWLRFFATKMPRFLTVVTLPIAGVCGFIGYHLESILSDRYTPGTAPIGQQRSERLLEDVDSPSSSVKKHNPLEVNLSPSLSS